MENGSNWSPQCHTWDTVHCLLEAVGLLQAGNQRRNEFEELNMGRKKRAVIGLRLWGDRQLSFGKEIRILKATSMFNAAKG